MNVSIIVFALLLAAFLPATSPAQAAPDQLAADQVLAPQVLAPRRSYFMGLKGVKDWAQSAGAKPGEVVLTSPPLSPSLEWNQMIPAWNATLPADAYLSFEVRGVYNDAEGGEHTTKYFGMGHWSSDPALHPRESVNNQADLDGDVDTDTLIMKRRGGSLQVRLTMGSSTLTPAELVDSVRFIGLAFIDSTIKMVDRVPNRAAWGKTVAVEPRFQMDYKGQGGEVWCSPTSTSMQLAHWSEIEHRPELTMTIPQVAHAVMDPVFQGTGNWAFNTSFAGSFPGMRGYVSRFDDLSEVEDWIAAGVPVALSVNYALLKGKPKDNSGHLVVCIGFTETGDAVIADPGHRPPAGEKYTVYPRHDVVAGWGASENTVYIVYPETFAPPMNDLQHWDG